MTGQVAGRRSAGSNDRIAPRPLVAVAVVIVYVIVTFGLQLLSGLPYSEWTSTASNTVRAAVLPLAAGSAVLIAFLAYARWDIVWRDPGRLPMTRAMTVALVFFVVCIVVRLVGVGWGRLDASLLLAVLATGVLVGFAEETLFRGIVLRCLRTGGRTEASAALWTAIGFGLFHLPNMIIGVGAAQLAQVVLAAITGVSLYLFRRSRGTIVLAMVAHGVWDISTFLVGSTGTPWVGIAGFVLLVVGVVVGVVALVSIWRTDRTTVVTPSGITGLSTRVT